MAGTTTEVVKVVGITMVITGTPTLKEVIPMTQAFLAFRHLGGRVLLLSRLTMLVMNISNN